MRVGDWFLTWINEHRARHPHVGLADPETPEGDALYRAWQKAFVMRGVSDFDVATEASERMVAEPPRYPKDHFPRLLELAVGVYRERNAVGQGNPEANREAAEEASKGCLWCGGQGLAVVYYRDPLRQAVMQKTGKGLESRWSVAPESNPSRTADGRRIPSDVAAYCVCALGRWIEKTHRDKSPDVRKRMVDLSDVLRGDSVWTAEPPEHLFMPVEPAPPAKPKTVQTVPEKAAF